MGLFKKMPKRPSIKEEKAFIEWTIRYDGQFKLFRKMVGRNLDGIIRGAIQGITTETDKCRSGKELLERLETIGDHFQTIMPLIEKRGGVLNSPLEMQAAF